MKIYCYEFVKGVYEFSRTKGYFFVSSERGKNSVYIFSKFIDFNYLSRYLRIDEMKFFSLFSTYTVDVIFLKLTDSKNIHINLANS